MTTSQLPLIKSFLYLRCSTFSPPLASMAKGTSAMLPLSYCTVVEDRGIQLGVNMTPNFSLGNSKVSLGRGLVKMSATCSCPDIFQLHILFCDLFSKKVKLDWNVLGLGMHNWILGDTDGTRIVT